MKSGILVVFLLYISSTFSYAMGLKIRCDYFDIKIYPEDVFLNGERMDNFVSEIDLLGLRYLFQEYAEAGDTLTYYLLDIPFTGRISLSWQWQDIHGQPLWKVNKIQCGLLKFHSDKKPQLKSLLDLHRGEQYDDDL